MHSTLFDSNTAKSGGSVHIANASVKLFSCNFTDQDASKNGGGLYFAKRDVHFRDFFVIYNRAVLDGGGIYAISETHLKGKNSRFCINLAGRRGGGLALPGGSVFKCSSFDIVDNKAKTGPDIYKEPHQPTSRNQPSKSQTPNLHLKNSILSLQTQSLDTKALRIYMEIAALLS